VLSLAKLQKYLVLAGCALAMSLGIQSCQPKYEDPGVAQYHNPPIPEQIAESLPDLPDIAASNSTPVAAAFNTPASPVAPSAIQSALVAPTLTPADKIVSTTKLAKVLAGTSAPSSPPLVANTSNQKSSAKADRKKQIIVGTNVAINNQKSYRVAVAIHNPIAEKYEDIAKRTGYLEQYPEIGSAETVEYQGQRLHKDAASAFDKMRQAADKDNVKIQVISGFRGIRAQADIFESKGGGLQAAEYSAPPGHSQHHTGLAIDINSLQPSFRTSKAFSWLKEHGSEHGFMLPYGNINGDLGPNNEPWHWVYVGKPPAMKLMAAFLGRARQANYDPLGGNNQLEVIYKSQTIAPLAPKAIERSAKIS
jgi:LAS superfamily LD-carboxypeptidase LdcB